MFTLRSSCAESTDFALALSTAAFFRAKYAPALFSVLGFVTQGVGMFYFTTRKKEIAGGLPTNRINQPKFQTFSSRQIIVGPQHLGQLFARDFRVCNIILYNMIHQFRQIFVFDPNI